METAENQANTRVFDNTVGEYGLSPLCPLSFLRTV